MGTSFEIRLYSKSPDLAAEHFALAFAEIERVEAALSHYRPTSEISRINARASLQPVTTDPEVFARQHGTRKKALARQLDWDGPADARVLITRARGISAEPMVSRRA